MSIADAGLFASFLMLATAITDGVRGVSGMGRLRLTKEHSPDRFWIAVALYFNMAFLTFWLSGKSYEADAEELMRRMENGEVVPILVVPSE